MRVLSNPSISVDTAGRVIAELKSDYLLAQRGSRQERSEYHVRICDEISSYASGGDHGQSAFGDRKTTSTGNSIPLSLLDGIAI